MRAAIYLMNRDDQVNKDMQVHLNDLRRVCTAHGWLHDEIFESCGSKGDQPQLTLLIEQIRQKHYGVLLVHSLSMFICVDPVKTYEMLTRIVDIYKCRFISLAEGIDSENFEKWQASMRLFNYFVNELFRTYSSLRDQYQNTQISQSIKAENDLKDTKDNMKRSGGRPKKDIDPKRLSDIKRTGMSVRQLTTAYNDGLPEESRVSKTTMAQALAAQGT